LGIPTVRDRVVQTALRQVLEPIFERDFAEHSYGFRPQRGCREALRRVDALLRQGYTWVVDADLKGYFDSIPHARLLERVRTKMADGRVLTLLQAFLDQQVLDGLETWTPEAGTPQGAVISPLLSNLYLDPLDHLMDQRGYAMVRYADDFVVLCRTRDEAERALETVRHWTAEAGLVLHPDKTRLVEATQPGGFDFLGYHFEAGRHWPGAKSIQKVRDRLRACTPRLSGQSLEALIQRLNPILRGWYAYFQHSPRYALLRMDTFVRQRLRSILRKHAKRHGIASGRENRDCPNSLFAAHGLFSLVAAHQAGCQSLRR